MGFPTTNDQHLGCFGGTTNLRKHQYLKMRYSPPKFNSELSTDKVMVKEGKPFLLGTRNFSRAIEKTSKGVNS